jgi:hypothetical protein
MPAPLRALSSQQNFISMDTPVVSTRTSEPSPAPPRRPWIVPTIEDLGEMRDLTLQDSIGGDCDVSDPLCFIP